MATKQQFNECLERIQRLIVDYRLDHSDVSLLTDMLKIINIKQSMENV